MNNLQIRTLKQFKSKHAFMTDNTADFPSGSPGARNTDALADVITRIESLAAQQSSDALHQSVGIKGDKFEALIKAMKRISKAAHSMGDEVEGIEDLFRLPNNPSEQIWLVKARAFYADSQVNETAFFEYLKKTFRADLQALITAAESSLTQEDIAGEHKGGATGGLAAAFRDGGKISRKLNGIVEIEYEDDPQKLAAWLIAAHLEKAPEHKDEAGEPGEVGMNDKG